MIFALRHGRYHDYDFNLLKNSETNIWVNTCSHGRNLRTLNAKLTQWVVSISTVL